MHHTREDTNPVHSTMLSQLGQNCPNKSAWDNFVHCEVYKDIFVHGDVALQLTGWLARILPHKPAISNVCSIYVGYETEVVCLLYR